MSFKLSIVLCLILFSAFSLAENSIKSTELFDVVKVNDSLYVITGKDYGTNIGVIISDSATILIDPMPGENKMENLSQLIKQLSNQPVKYVINTHLHEDHNGGNEFFQQSGSIIINVRTLNNNNKLKSSVNLKSELTKLGIEIAPVSSHSDEDLLIYHLTSNSLFTGDVFDNSWHPTFYAGALDGLNGSIKQIDVLSNESSFIVPGHGKIADKLTVEAFRSNTVAWVARVSELNKKGLSIDQISLDKTIQSIVERFNTNNKTEFLSEVALKRFIDRTLEYVLKVK